MSRADRAGRPTPEPPARAGKTASPLRDGAPAAGTKRWRWIRRIAILAVALAALAGARASGLQELLDVDRMRALVAPWGRGAPLLYVPIFVAGVLLHLPALALVAIGTLLFGAVWGFVSAWIGAVVGTALIFLVGRHLARDAVRTALGARFAHFRRLDERLRTRGFRMVLVLRLLLFLAPPLNWAMGATSVGFGTYVGATALGVVPGIAGTVYLAESLADLNSAADLLKPEFLLPLLLVTALLGGALVAGRRILADLARPD